jgi:hypothetical protein
VRRPLLDDGWKADVGTLVGKALQLALAAAANEASSDIRVSTTSFKDTNGHLARPPGVPSVSRRFAHIWRKQSVQ